MTDNYIMFKKFIRHFCMNKRMKKSDIPAYVDVFKLIKDNALCSRHTKPQRLKPFVFYTDGGIDNDSWCYFIDKLFTENSQYCYSTRTVDPKSGGVNIQAYLGRVAQHSGDIRPIEHRKDPTDPMII